ncbi:hypothetical protein [Indioceanicola profundi]|uniref:hypothetical protein n=1 Tax=Indioceanicola profundi TaxID=2220096 RepID=UPI0013C4A1BC|nr:hypothetical protein [Indioceanicola profundi]
MWSQSENRWFVDVVGQDSQFFRATEYGPHVLTEAECRPAGSANAEAEPSAQAK